MSGRFFHGPFLRGSRCPFSRHVSFFETLRKQSLPRRYFSRRSSGRFLTSIFGCELLFGVCCRCLVFVGGVLPTFLFVCWVFCARKCLNFYLLLRLGF